MHCSFSTDRLIVDEWHRQVARFDLNLVSVVGNILTAATTAALPPEWRGDFDAERARRWIEARDIESPTLLAVESETGLAIGLLILFETAGELPSRGVDVRLGYVVAESARGRGFATELVAGLVEWSQSEPSICTISAGVAPASRASVRILRKNGFVLSAVSNGEHSYRISAKPTGDR
jgi:RimJ/RimL family protein N-acetyltransferase